MDSRQKERENTYYTDSQQAGITSSFLLIASLVAVVTLTGLVCVVAAGILGVLR